MIIAVWIVTFLLLAVWTLAAWGLASLVSVGGFSLDGVGPALARAPFAGVLEAWFPAWQEWTMWVLQAMQSLLQWLGAAAPVLVWGLWFAGALVLLLVAGLLTLLVALLRRAMPQQPQQPQQPPPAPPPQQQLPQA